MRSLSAFLLAIGILGAQTPDVPAPVETPVRKMGLARPIVIDGAQEVYGAPLAGKELVPLKKVLAEDKAWDGKTIQIRGKITGVCEKKGCWMMLEDGEQAIRIRFKDYKFFVPLDVSGREVAVEGLFVRKVETEAERKHTVDVPEIVPIIWREDRDVGVNSLGEPPSVPVPGAIGTAVANAIGVQVTSMPITPDKVLAALSAKEATA